MTRGFVDAANGKVKNTTGGNYQNWAQGSFTPQPDGFTGVFRSLLTPVVTSIHYWNHDGVYIQAGQAMQGSPAFTAMPMGGVLVAGDFNSKHQAAMFGRGGTDLAWGHDLASKGAVFGLGGDAQNLAIVITDSGPGTITAQWFDTRGTRRVDQQNDSSGRPYQTAQCPWAVPTHSHPADALDDDAAEHLRLALVAGRSALRVWWSRRSAAFQLPDCPPFRPATQPPSPVAPFNLHGQVVRLRDRVLEKAL